MEISQSEPSNYHLAHALLKEYEESLRYKKMYEELSEGLKGLIEEAMEFCKINGIELGSDQRQKLHRILLHAQALFDERVNRFSSRDFEQSRNHTGDRTEPNIVCHDTFKQRQWFRVAGYSGLQTIQRYRTARARPASRSADFSNSTDHLVNRRVRAA